MVKSVFLFVLTIRKGRENRSFLCYLEQAELMWCVLNQLGDILVSELNN